MVDPTDPVVRDLDEQVQQEYVDRYGGPDRTPLEPAQFRPPDGTFLLARLDGAPAAIGGVRRRDEHTAEVKRMFVVAHARRRGVARRMLAALEQAAAGLGYTRLVLETGPKQPEAVALYAAAGYVPVPPFGYYAAYPGVHSLGKNIADAPPPG